MKPGRFGLSWSQLLLVLLMAIVLVVVAVFQNQPRNIEPYDPDDSSGTGLRALVLWLEELGYPVTIAAHHAELPAETSMLMIFPSNPANLDSYFEEEVNAFYDWVAQGGTLILVGPTIPYEELSLKFGVEQVDAFMSVVSNVRQVQPLLPDLPSHFDGFSASNALYFLDDEVYGQRTVVPLLAHTNGDPAVALQLIGDGVVWHMTEDFAFTNLNLRDDLVASLLPAILRTVGDGAPVVISTQHLSNTAADDEIVGEVTTLQDWLYTTPFGQATLLVMVSTFAFLLLQGRRLGPALPGSTATRPREAAEYVTALAGLQRRTRKPSIVSSYHRQRLKHEVGRLAQVPADLPDSEWLAQLRIAQVLSPAMFDEVASLLAAYAKFDAADSLAGKSVNEAELIQLVQSTDALLASLPRANMQLVR